FLTFTIPDVLCDAAPGTDVLRLPNCTSWHSNQGTLCDIDGLNDDPLVAGDLDFDPDTKSKCVCDDDFTIGVTVEQAEISVFKTAFPETVPESGQWVTYMVEVTNDSEFEPVTIFSLTDIVSGVTCDLGESEPAGVIDNDCDELIGTTLDPKGSVWCEFKAFVSGDAGDLVTAPATACATQGEPPEESEPFCASDDASVE